MASALRSSHPPHLLPHSVVVWRNGVPVSGGLLRFGGRYFGGQWPPLSVLIWRPCFVLDPRFARVFIYLAAGRSCAFCGPRVRWAWACGWDAGGPLFTSLRGSGDAWARGILVLAPFCFPALQPIFRLRRGLPRWSGRLRRSPPLSYSSSRRRPSFFTHYTLRFMLLCLAVPIITNFYFVRATNTVSLRNSKLYGLPNNEECV